MELTVLVTCGQGKTAPSKTEGASHLRFYFVAGAGLETWCRQAVNNSVAAKR